LQNSKTKREANKLLKFPRKK